MDLAQALQAVEDEDISEKNIIVYTKFVMDTLAYIDADEISAPWERFNIASDNKRIKYALIKQSSLIRFFVYEADKFEQMIQHHKKHKQAWTAISCLKWCMTTGWITQENQIHAVTLHLGLDREEEVEEIITNMLSQTDELRALAAKGDILR